MKFLTFLHVLMLAACGPIGTSNPLDRVEYDQVQPTAAAISIATPGTPPIPPAIPIQVICPAR